MSNDNKKYLGEIYGVPIISDPKATDTYFRAPLASDPAPQPLTVDEIIGELEEAINRFHRGAKNEYVTDIQKARNAIQELFNERFEAACGKHEENNYGGLGWTPRKEHRNSLRADIRRRWYAAQGGEDA